MLTRLCEELLCELVAAIHNIRNLLLAIIHIASINSTHIRRIKRRGATNVGVVADG